nr:unnamed protein product [Digitaria exilis]
MILLPSYFVYSAFWRSNTLSSPIFATMELPSAAWVPCNIQMDNWTMEPTVWASGFPAVEYQYAANEIFDAQEFDVDLNNMEAKIRDNTICAFQETAQEFKDDMDTMRMKIHRYPASLRGFDEWYSVPRMVAMGPYHHGRVLQDHLKQVEKYMLWCTPAATEMEASLHSFFDFNRKVLRHDLMLLENQLPWLVVETVMRFRPVELVDFVADWRHYLKDRKVLEEKPIVLDDRYEPPHLLGLLQFYMVGRSNTRVHTRDKFNSISVSVSAIELVEIGIMLTAKETRELIHMGISKKGILSAELSYAPLSLDDERASFLINMAALELCTTSNF